MVEFQEFCTEHGRARSKNLWMLVLIGNPMRYSEWFVILVRPEEGASSVHTALIGGTELVILRTRTLNKAESDVFSELSELPNAWSVMPYVMDGLSVAARIGAEAMEEIMVSRAESMP